MPLRISFNLRDDDLRHFEEVAQQTQASVRQRSAQEIVAAARQVLEESQRAQQAEFVRERFSRLAGMIDMAVDPDWPLGAEDSQRLINALACFSGAESAARTGFLDQAILVELVSRDLEHDLAAHREFCKLRAAYTARSRAGMDADAQRNEWLNEKREGLQRRMHERRRRDLDKAGSSVRKLFSLFGL